MGSELSAKSKQQLERFCRQFLQLDIFDWPDEENLRNDAFQQELYARLFAEDAIEHQPPPRYQLRVLKELTRRIEESIVDWEKEGISDDLMLHLSSLFSSPLPSEAASAQQKAYVTYTISSLPPSTPKSTPATITLLESHFLVAAAGTTGLRTWEAALHLGNYLSTNPHLIEGKSVLELGAGTGFLSILCARHLKASHVLSTDGSPSVINSLPTNFSLNQLEASVPVIEARELRWGQALEDPDWNHGRKVDIVLGADVTYDETASRALVATFADLFAMFPQVRIVIAAAVRNERTFETFLEVCRLNGFGYERIEFVIPGKNVQEGPFYEDRVPIELSCITKGCS